METKECGFSGFKMNGFLALFFCLKINIHFASVFSEIISIFASLTN